MDGVRRVEGCVCERMYEHTFVDELELFSASAFNKVRSCCEESQSTGPGYKEKLCVDPSAL